MELNLGRLGHSLSDRLVVDREGGINTLHASDSCWAWFIRLIISWIWSPSGYSDENRRAVACVKTYLIDQLGAERLQRICSRYDINLTRMQEKGSPLLSRDLAKIITGIHDVKIEDIEDLIDTAKRGEDAWPEWIPEHLRAPLRDVDYAQQLDSATFAQVYHALADFRIEHTVKEIDEDSISGGAPTESMACFWHDAFLADRERMVLMEENSNDDFEAFVHNAIARIIPREMDVGMLIPAPNHPDGREQFYRVSGKVISGKGMVSYVLLPATEDTHLQPVRFYRGTMARPSAIDSSSTLITDLERNLGETAFQSGKIYEPYLKAALGPIPVVVGHSLGSTIAQKDAVHNTDIKEMYLFNGPGITKKEIDEFNQRMAQAESENILLHIRDSHTDHYSAVGQAHLGYNAPLDEEGDYDKVVIDYRKYYPTRNTPPSYAHVQVPHRENRFHGIEGGHTAAQVNELLHRSDLEASNECCRVSLGPIIAKIIELIRDFFRWLFGSRTYEQLGLHIGMYERGKWRVKHFRPEDLPYSNLVN